MFLYIDEKEVKEALLNHFSEGCVEAEVSEITVCWFSTIIETCLLVFEVQVAIL